MTTVQGRVQPIRATAAVWTAENIVLLDAEVGYETDTGKFKIGDGVSTWAALPYFTGEQGPAGADGADAFVYIAYADDDTGTGFTNTFNASKDYIAIKSTTTEIVTPVVGDFTGLWKNYMGAKGDTGAGVSVVGAADGDVAVFDSVSGNYEPEPLSAELAYIRANPRLIVYDTFNRANTVSGIGDTITGQTYLYAPSVSFKIQDKEAVGISSSSGGLGTTPIAYIPTALNSYTVKLKWNAFGEHSSSVNVVLSFVDSSNFFIARFSSTVLAFYEVQAGVLTAISGTTTAQIGVGKNELFASFIALTNSLFIYNGSGGVTQILTGDQLTRFNNGLGNVGFSFGRNTMYSLLEFEIWNSNQPL